MQKKLENVQSNFSFPCEKTSFFSQEGVKQQCFNMLSLGGWGEGSKNYENVRYRKVGIK